VKTWLTAFQQFSSIFYSNAVSKSSFHVKMFGSAGDTPEEGHESECVNEFFVFQHFNFI
jgi:hypothetical protein